MNWRKGLKPGESGKYFFPICSQRNVRKMLENWRESLDPGKYREILWAEKRKSLVFLLHFVLYQKQVEDVPDWRKIS